MDIANEIVNYLNIYYKSTSNVKKGYSCLVINRQENLYFMYFFDKPIISLQ